jgi:release factor glutamine methyltransferase
MSPTIKISQALQNARAKLQSISDSPRLDAELLLAHVLQKPRNYVLAYEGQALSEFQWETFQAVVAQRVKKIPLAYILSEKEFWSLKFRVTPDVLIPRPETELLVEKILEDYLHASALTLVDLGTGSGAIALALAHEKPSWKIIASDSSEKALAVAQANARALTKTSLTFIHSAWFENFPKNFKADVVVSNPPYLAANDPHLMGSEISHEPREALVAANNGLAAYEAIAAQAQAFLKPEGRIYVEHGCDQAKSVQKIFKTEGYQAIQTFTDLAGLPRLMVVKLL